MNENWVVSVAPLSVPDITPVEVFKDKPPGNVPLVLEYVIGASPVAVTVVEIDVAAEKLPKEPAPVDHSGPSETVNTDPEEIASPSGFWIKILYVPSIEIVKVAVKLVAEVKATDEAVILAPLVVLTASTKGIDAKPVPVIVILEDVLSITEGLIEVNVGPVSGVVI